MKLFQNIENKFHNKMKTFFPKIILLFYLITLPISSIEYNPWNLDIMERIVSRKNISHIIVEPRTEYYRVTFIVSDRFPYNYKSRQGFFFLRCTNVDDAYELAKEFDKYLVTGKEIYFKLNGSEITHYRFLD